MPLPSHAGSRLTICLLTESLRKEATMERYHCYVIDCAHRVDWATEIECDNDNSARGQADEILAEHPAHGVELWRNEKLVYRAERPGGPTH
jgi:hypothetical protein